MQGNQLKKLQQRLLQDRLIWHDKYSYLLSNVKIRLSGRIVFNLLSSKYIFTGDKNELMRERLRQEKAKTNGGKEREAQQKRKSQAESTGGQKKKKTTQKQTESTKEKEQKAKDKEEKQKKKDQDQERQKFLLEARKAQAASRWGANDEVTKRNPANGAFTPQPIRQTGSHSSTPLTPANTTLSSDRTANTSESTPQESPPVNLTLLAKRNMPTKTTASSKSKGTCEPRRGLHFQSAIAGTVAMKKWMRRWKSSLRRMTLMFPVVIAAKNRGWKQRP